MKRYPRLLMLLFLASYPLGVKGDDATQQTRPAETKAHEPHADMPFVIYRIDSWSSIPVILVDDYGIMLINDGIDKQPSPRFVIAFKSSRTLIDTKDLRIAALALKMIPKGSRIRQYDSCTMSRSYGLPARIRDELNVAIKSAGLVLFEDQNITCYCGPE